MTIEDKEAALVAGLAKIGPDLTDMASIDVARLAQQLADA